MNMINKGIPYFPTPANFFDEEVMELLEAKFGVLASYMVMRLLCKIYKRGILHLLGKEQNLIFVRKVGGGIKEDMMEKDCRPVIGKRFFSIKKPTRNTVYSLRNRFKECGSKLHTKKNRFLTTTLFIRDQTEKKRIHKDELNKENANIFPTQEEVSSEKCRHFSTN